MAFAWEHAIWSWSRSGALRLLFASEGKHPLLQNRSFLPFQIAYIGQGLSSPAFLSKSPPCACYLLFKNPITKKLIAWMVSMFTLAHKESALVLGKGSICSGNLFHLSSDRPFLLTASDPFTIRSVDEIVVKQNHHFTDHHFFGFTYHHWSET